MEIMTHLKTFLFNIAAVHCYIFIFLNLLISFPIYKKKKKFLVEFRLNLNLPGYGYFGGFGEKIPHILNTCVFPGSLTFSVRTFLADHPSECEERKNQDGEHDGPHLELGEQGGHGAGVASSPAVCSQ